MAINISGILKTPQGSAIQNAEIIFEQTRTSTEVLAGTKFSVITNQTGNYSSSLGVGTYVFKVRFQDETQYRTVASNVIVTQSMNNYTLNQIIQDQSQLQDVDYDLLQAVIQARDQAAASAQAAQTSQATATTKASEASSSAQAALASKNAAQTSEANALSSKNAAQTSQTNAANSQTAAATSQTTATTKATEASNSAQAALTSKNAAQTSEANALASKNAAQASQTTASTKASEAAASQTTASTKAGEASASQTQAQQSQSDAGAAASQADDSEQQAQQSQTAAAGSQSTATAKASEASSSAQAALASKNAAQTSETNALASKNQAQTSQTNAANSQTAAAASQTTATTKAGEASTSQTNAAASQTTATTKAGEASTSQTNAAASQTTATTKAGEASSSQTAAASSQSTATTKATEATNSATLAQKWAANPENSVVSGGLYSALHYAAKAAQSAQTATGQLVWRGGWSAQAGTAPPTPTGTTQDFYRITQAGTILSVQYEIGDYIHWDNLNSIWFKMDGTDSVTSVNGRTGAVVVTKTDVGLSAVNNWGASSQTNDASTTTYATTAGVKAAYDLAATKLAATANAVSATKLATTRTINGTNFDGTANITTQNWGTSRNLTIGGTAKAVDGSANVSWTLAEIGAISTTLLPTGSNYQDVVGKLLRVGSDGVQEVGRILDFHAENSTLDNDVRFTVTNTIGTTSSGDLDISANTIKVRGNEVYHQGNTSPGALGAVPDTRTVNGKRLNADITVTSEDVGTYTKQVIDEQSLKTVTIQAPQGVVAGKYYPIVVSNYGSDHSLFVETRSSGGADPMNYCSFDGQIHNGGWSDTGVYVYGQFTIYSSSERQIHSILGSSEAQTAYAIYVEARAFPVNVRVRASANVACTGLDMSYGTTVFAQAVTNPQAGVGTKTRLLAEFQPGNHFYSSNTMICRAGVETQSTVVVNKDRTDVGSLALGGNVQGYAEIAGKAAGQAGYNYDEGLRYYNDNTWRIGSKKILHDGGGTLLGQLSTTFNSAAPITLDRGSQVGIGYKYSATQTQYLGVDVSGQLRFGQNLDHSANGYVYTTDRKPTAADVGALQAEATAVAATKLATARTIGGVAFDGTANINLPGVNTAGNQSTTGNAATATKLATARTIAGVAFDGTANITLTASNVGAVPNSLLEAGSGSVMRTDGAEVAALEATINKISFRNKIHNGKMEISQRGASIPLTIAAPVEAKIDRFNCGNSTAARGTVNQTVVDSTYPNPSIRKCLSVELTAAVVTPVPSNQHLRLAHVIEGYEVQELTSKPFVLSFTAKTTKAGTYCVAFRNGTRTKTIVVQYTLPAGVWTPITIPMSALPAGFVTDFENGIGLEVCWALATAAELQTNTTNTMIDGQFLSTNNQVTWGTSISDTFQLTEVQLEVGTAKTEFEHRPYPVELQLCQRYLLNLGWDEGTSGTLAAGGMCTASTCILSIHTPTQMRATPSYTGGALTCYSGNGSTGTGTVTISRRGSSIMVNQAMTGAAGQAAYLATSSTSGFRGFVAELL